MSAEKEMLVGSLRSHPSRKISLTMLLDIRAPGLVIVAGEVGLAGSIPSRVAVRRPPAAVLAGSSPAAVLADSLRN
jgi:hypothetical protein